MDYYGLFPKFKLNRELNDEEIKHQLKQHQLIKLDGQSLVPDMKVITLNSHYLELVDKYFSAKGFLSLIAAFVFFQHLCFTLLFFLTPFHISGGCFRKMKNLF
ncbi:hypothetical protein L8T16_06310 [Enterobacter cloacae]|uniref:hypothetical protein n=1 Tax=Enterobacter cloacae TaxID=550 RepID=UPI002005E03F|nr:hypothetical protein [Enterobacter cloacae]MCK6746666.1 hypothetical protein [Enterobacter cloacae]